jgi:hypothetical protein
LLTAEEKKDRIKAVLVNNGGVKRESYVSSLNFLYTIYSSILGSFGKRISFWVALMTQMFILIVFRDNVFC